MGSSHYDIMRRTLHTGPILFLILAAALLLYLGFARDLEGNLSLLPGATNSSTTLNTEPPDKPTEKATPSVSISGTRIRVDVATTTLAVRKGLSGRTRLEEDEGMLFIFPVPDIYRFWMPDMNFPIDIIWIHDGAVADISRNVSNEFDSANPRFYSPRSKVEQVLEVNAGFAAKHGISVGDPVVLRNIF